MKRGVKGVFLSECQQHFNFVWHIHQKVLQKGNISYLYAFKKRKKCKN